MLHRLQVRVLYDSSAVSMRCGSVISTYLLEGRSLAVGFRVKERRGLRSVTTVDLGICCGI